MGRRTETGCEAVPTGASKPKIAKLPRSKVRRRKSGGRVVKGGVLTWGDLASCLKGRRGIAAEREVSRGRSRSRRESLLKDQTERRAIRP